MGIAMAAALLIDLRFKAFDVGVLVALAVSTARSYHLFLILSQDRVRSILSTLSHTRSLELELRPSCRLRSYHLSAVTIELI